ncbi:MAG: PQQ-like beta-propeller repeat protein [Phycisphaerae bacterium]|nr:PQQ-like beta-propeller repeat protein [Phycisphaerae bacterium]
MSDQSSLNDVLYVGIKGHVVAIDKRSGQELWRTKLGGYSLVNILVDTEMVFAYAKGHVFGLTFNGEVLWDNGMPGLGYSMALLATQGVNDPAAAIMQDIQARQAAAASSSATTN